MNSRHLTILLITVLLFMGCSENPVKLGYESLALGDYDMAIEFFNKEIRRSPRNFDARLGMGKALLQKSYANNQDTIYWSKALVQLSAARSIKPDDHLNSLLKDAWIVYGRNKLASLDTMGALMAMTFALDYDPQNTEALNMSAILFSNLGFIEKAESLFTVAHSVKKTDTDFIFNIGMLYFYRKQYSDALRVWNSVAESDTADKKIRHWISIAQKQTAGK